MDAPLLTRLEAGEVEPAAPEVPPAAQQPTAPEVARLWAVELGLRPGGSVGPIISALVPVVERWAAARGWTGPEHRYLGVGLKAAGLVRRAKTSGGTYSRLLLHPADARRLKQLCREAWAPARPPGDPVCVWKPRPRPHKLPPALFHAELKRLKGNAKPLMDSTGRVWPSAKHAAEALGPTTRPPSAPATGEWSAKPTKGLLWRRLTPAEVAAIPQGTRCGDRLGVGLVLCRPVSVWEDGGGI